MAQCVLGIYIMTFRLEFVITRMVREKYGERQGQERPDRALVYESLVKTLFRLFISKFSKRLIS